MGITSRSSPIVFLFGVVLLLAGGLKLVPYFFDTEEAGFNDILFGVDEEQALPDTPAEDDAVVGEDEKGDGLIDPKDYMVKNRTPEALPPGHHYEIRVESDGTTQHVVVKDLAVAPDNTPVIIGALMFGGLLIMGVTGGTAVIEARREEEENEDEDDNATPIQASHTVKTALATIPDEAPGVEQVGGAFVAGRYRLISKLGEGGMASVYRAWDTEDNAWRAIKVLLPKFRSRSRLRIRFANEATTMQRITHRNVVQIFDVGVDAPLPFFVMEMARGGCLIDWVDAHGAMPARMAVDVIMQVCKGVSAAHAIGVIHRDIKPHNILMTRRGHCKLTDFGIAQIQDRSMTKTGNVMGTMGYISPEQRTDAKHVDVRTDVYSIGATLYKLLTAGKVIDLFVAEHDATIFKGVPVPLVSLLIKCTSYNPEDRFNTVKELTKALHAARKNLDEVPANTPDLAMPLQETDIDAQRAVPASEFADISDIIDERIVGQTILPVINNNTTFITEE
ncbi:MAG: protein kinase [Rhodobacterales bacterium]|nr:protein kinase [Rhodobacterales bacterium]